jgi:hypothetical protein
MRKIFFIVFSLVILNINLAHSAEISTEGTVSVAFERFKDIMYPIDKKSDSKIRNLDIAMDYAVEILKTKPDSICSYYVLMTYYPIASNEIAIEKYMKLKNKFYNLLTKPNEDTAEKLFFLILAVSHDDEFISSININAINSEKYFNGILKIKNECVNSNYRALAALASIRYTEDLKIFTLNYPNHGAIPFIKLMLYDAKIAKNKNDKKNIEEILKLSEQYKELKLIDGKYYWTACYDIIGRAFYSIGDYVSAKKYMLLIKEKAPKDFNEYFYESILRKIEQKRK